MSRIDQSPRRRLSVKDPVFCVDGNGEVAPSLEPARPFYDDALLDLKRSSSLKVKSDLVTADV